MFKKFKMFARYNFLVSSVIVVCTAGSSEAENVTAAQLKLQPIAIDAGVLSKICFENRETGITENTVILQQGILEYTGDTCRLLNYAPVTTELDELQLIDQISKLQNRLELAGNRENGWSTFTDDLQSQLHTVTEKLGAADQELQRLQIALAASLARQDEMARQLEAVHKELEDKDIRVRAQFTELSDLQRDLARALLDLENQRDATDAANLQRDRAEERIAELENALEQLAGQNEGALKSLEQQLAEALAAKVKAEGERQNLTKDLQAALAARLASDAMAAERLSALDELKSDTQIQLQNLGNRLNAALARAATEERKRRKLQEAERLRLQAEAKKIEEERNRLADQAQDLANYKSEFFGRLREILAGQEGVKIVGDRFVFSSEVLFEPGAASLSGVGRFEIDKVANILLGVKDRIPDTIEWVIRVDGHTDDTELSGNGRYLDNWELSQARALSVVRYMIETHQFPANRMAANGFGEYQPIAKGNTHDARSLNRRIEIKLSER